MSDFNFDSVWDFNRLELQHWDSRYMGLPVHTGLELRSEHQLRNFKRCSDKVIKVNPGQIRS